MKNILSVIAIILLFTLSLVCGGFFVYKLFTVFISLPKELSVAIIAGVLTVFGSVFTVVYSKRHEKLAEINKELRIKKVPVYEGLISFIFTVIFSSREGKKPMSEKEMMNNFEKYTKELTIWGSDEVIKSYSEFRKSIINQSINPDDKSIGVQSIFLFEELMRSIRKDLGYKNKSIERGDLLSLFINDMDVYAKEDEQ